MIPAHLDLQKIGDLYINKEKYKVLKPAIHSVRDHFQDKMMRRDTQLPSDRVFLDGNGFRHFWNVFKEKSKSLRRLIPENEVDVIEGQDNVNAPSRRKAKPRSAKVTKSAVKATSTTAKANNAKAARAIKVTKGTTKVSKTTEEDPEEETEATTRKSKPTTTKASPITKEGPKRKTPGRYSVRKKQLNKKKSGKVLRSSITKLVKRTDSTNDGKERTLVKTTFFCPFFGVMTMHSYLDDDASKPAEEKGDDDKKDQDKDKEEDKEKKNEDKEKKE